MTHYEATPEQWHELEKCSYDSQPWAPCILELCARVKQLEDAAHKHIVETSSNIVALFTRVESLEAAERQASKVYEISKPLQLTPEQAQHVRDLLTPNSKPIPNSSQVRSSLEADAKRSAFELSDDDPIPQRPIRARSLVNRVAVAISGIEYGLERDEEAVNWESEARAAIREVAAWLRECYGGPTASSTALEQEVE
jgi:hypothetical protein